MQGVYTHLRLDQRGDQGAKGQSADPEIIPGVDGFNDCEIDIVNAGVCRLSHSRAVLVLGRVG